VGDPQVAILVHRRVGHEVPSGGALGMKILSHCTRWRNDGIFLPFLWSKKEIQIRSWFILSVFSA